VSLVAAETFKLMTGFGEATVFETLAGAILD